MLDINVTFVIQILNFLLALILVDSLLVRPVRDIIARRRACGDALRRGIEACEARIAEDTAACETALGAAREKCERLLRRSREHAVTTQADLLARANRDAAGYMREERERLVAQHRQAREALAPVVRDLADAAVARLLA